MKSNMRLLDRILLAAYAVVGIAVTVAFAAAALIDNGLEVRMLGYSIRMGDGFWPSVGMALIALVALVWSVWMLLLAFRRPPKNDVGSVSVQSAENGSVRVSVEAIDTLVKRAIGSAEGIVDLHTHVINYEDSISVRIEMTLQSDVHIPNVTMLMQRSIKNFIEEFSGIAVRDVSVLVTGIVEVTPTPPLALEDKARFAAVEPTHLTQAEPAAEAEAEAEPDAEAEPEPDAETQPVSEDEPLEGETVEPEGEPEPLQSEPEDGDAPDALDEGDEAAEQTPAQDAPQDDEPRPAVTQAEDSYQL